MSVFKRENLKKLELQPRKIKKHIIMIVDDEEDHLRSMKALLSEEYHIITATDGQEALDIIKTIEHPENISIVIADQRMPKLKGLQLFEKIKDIIPKTIRMILTGYVDIPVLIDAVNKTRVYQFIPKPFEPEELKLMVKHAIEAFENQVKKEEYRRTLEEQIKKLRQENKELQAAKRKLVESINVST